MSNTNTTSVAVAAGVDATRRAVERLDLAAPAIRALRALGLDDRVRLRPGALRFGVPGSSGHVDVSVAVAIDAASKDSCVLTIVTVFRATDDRARARLLDAWPIIDPLARNLAQRAARTVKEYAESDQIDAAAFGRLYADAV